MCLQVYILSLTRSDLPRILLVGMVYLLEFSFVNFCCSEAMFLSACMLHKWLEGRSSEAMVFMSVHFVNGWMTSFVQKLWSQSKSARFVNVGGRPFCLEATSRLPREPTPASNSPAGRCRILSRAHRRQITKGRTPTFSIILSLTTTYDTCDASIVFRSRGWYLGNIKIDRSSL